MNPKRFEEKLQETLKRMQAMLGDKNTEYANSNTDRLMNFKRRAERLGLDPLSVLSVDIEKHIDAFNNFVIRNRNSTHVLLNDPITRRLADIANYCFLAECLIEDMAIASNLSATGAEEHADLSNQRHQPVCMSSLGCKSKDLCKLNGHCAHK